MTLIDTAAHQKHIARSKRINNQEAAFLITPVAEDLAERIALVSRTFNAPIILDMPTSYAIDAFAQLGNIENAIEAIHTVSEDVPIPIKLHSCDLVLSILNLQWLNDVPGALIQINRALKADGLFLGALIGGQTLHELRTCLLEAEVEITGKAYPRVLPFINVKDAGHLLQRAGFTLPVTDTQTYTVRYDNLFDLMKDLRHMGAVNCMTERQKSLSNKQIFQKAAQLYQDNFSDADGRIRASFEIISLSGWKAHESQQKPLKPGSAKKSLLDVLPQKSDT